MPVVAKDFYVYQEDFATVTFATSQTGNINIQADSDFQLLKMTYFAVADSTALLTANTELVPPISLQITDSGSGRNLFEAAVPISNVFGTGRLPFILPTPKLFPARSTITVNISNFGTGSDTTLESLRLSFIGYKIFRTGQ